MKVKDQLVSTHAMIKILFLAANPQDRTWLQIDKEMRAIDQALRMTEYRDRFDLRSHWAVQISDLQEQLLRHQPDIVHLSGHGSDTNEIIFQNEAGESYPVPVSALSELFEILQGKIRCVILNACYTEVQALAISQHIDCVIGISATISDKAAISFATSLYRGLGYGHNVETAFRLGCSQINLENLGEQYKPQLITHSSNSAQISFVNDPARLLQLKKRIPKERKAMKTAVDV